MALKYGLFFYNFDRSKPKMTGIKNKKHLIASLLRIIRIANHRLLRRKDMYLKKKIKSRKLQGEAPSVLILQIRSRDSISGRAEILQSSEVGITSTHASESRQTPTVEALGCSTAYQVKEERT